MDFADNCAECKRLSANYESATMAWFRVQGQLRIADYSRDQAASDKIVAEMTRIGKRRDQLRQAAEEHIAAAHPRTATASSSLL